MESGFQVWLIGHETMRAELFAVLSEEERAHARRLARAEDRAGFVTSRAALRNLLGAALGQPPSAVRFSRNAAGKPLIDAREGPPVSDFSVSRAGGTSAIALAARGRIGVDIAEVRDIPEREAIARDMLSPTLADRLAELPAATANAAFLDLWTASEAYAKAVGRGFGEIAGTVPVTLDAASAAVLGPGAGAWRLVRLLLPAGLVGMLIVEDAEAPPAFRPLSVSCAELSSAQRFAPPAR